jgi:anti-sigma factor RsiW
MIMLSDHEHIRDDDLMMYFDAELSEGQSAIVRRHLTACADCKGRLDVLERLHSFVEMVARDTSADLPAEEMFARVEKGISQQQKAGFGERFRVTVSETIEHRRSSVIVPVVAALAAAAVVLGVLVMGDDAAPEQARPILKRAREMLAEDATPSPSGTSVHDVNFGESTGTVFQVEDAEGSSFAVVWINDEEEVPGADTPEEVPQ